MPDLINIAHFFGTKSHAGFDCPFGVINILRRFFKSGVIASGEQKTNIRQKTFFLIVPLDFWRDS